MNRRIVWGIDGRLNTYRLNMINTVFNTLGSPPSPSHWMGPHQWLVYFHQFFWPDKFWSNSSLQYLVNLFESSPTTVYFGLRRLCYHHYIVGSTLVAPSHPWMLREKLFHWKFQKFDVISTEGEWKLVCGYFILGLSFLFVSIMLLRVDAWCRCLGHLWYEVLASVRVTLIVLSYKINGFCLKQLTVRLKVKLLQGQMYCLLHDVSYDQTGWLNEDVSSEVFWFL